MIRPSIFKAVGGTISQFGRPYSAIPQLRILLSSISVKQMEHNKTNQFIPLPSNSSSSVVYNDKMEN